jgi:hypothetical protein
VRLGANSLDTREPDSMDVTSRYSIVHMNYDSTLLRNDIAVVHLPEPVYFTSECSSS